MVDSQSILDLVSCNVLIHGIVRPTPKHAGEENRKMQEQFRPIEMSVKSQHQLSCRSTRFIIVYGRHNEMHVYSMDSSFQSTTNADVKALYRSPAPLLLFLVVLFRCFF